MAADLGSTAPDFTLTDHDRKLVTLSSARGRPVVLAFFPAAFSSVCAKEMCAFRDSLAELNKVGKAEAQIYGISVDTFFALKAFHDSQQLTFPLLSDFNKEVIRAYDVFNDDMIGLNCPAQQLSYALPLGFRAGSFRWSARRGLNTPGVWNWLALPEDFHGEVPHRFQAERQAEQILTAHVADL